MVKNTNLPTTARFFSLVEITSKCWNWIGATDVGGYGKFWLNNKLTQAHRFLVRDDIPKGMLALHRCDNRKCVNPAHIFFGTQGDNLKDMINKGRKNGESKRMRDAMRGSPYPSGESHKRSKLTLAQVIDIRSTPPKFGYIAALAKKHGVSFSTVSNVLAGLTWNPNKEKNRLIVK